MSGDGGGSPEPPEPPGEHGLPASDHGLDDMPVTASAGRHGSSHEESRSPSPESAPASRRNTLAVLTDGPKPHRRRGRTRGGGLWALLAAPGTLWLVLLFAVPFYAIAAVAFGSTDPVFNAPVPEWDPRYWDFTAFTEILTRSVTGDLRPVFLRTLLYVALALGVCVAIGYPVAYYVARHAGRRRALLLGLILAPWWVNYLTRMLAWLNLLQDDGYVNDLLTFTRIVDEPVRWLSGNPVTVVLALVYGYIPFFIVPLFSTLDRIDPLLLEAARDLGCSSRSAFWHVTLPLSRPGLLTASAITALPMFGDYYTNTLVSGSPTTTMIANQIEFYLLGGTRKELGASLVLLLSALLMVVMVYYLISSRRAEEGL
ncbi:ABC transporter permease [Herbidospora sp. NBRC 101105]|uniref:ABC transporter permease n=1 Tax=Herbidospora sp. NBRC 101105 TaxID=3032195 RepID=UPI0024A04402|nr:ABC transporter permease [Herbidospora sp. NBRC 101105]GLX94175.1 polyamine ABC transporter permease [Herbidospora sp. NBRC 101105]